MKEILTIQNLESHKDELAHGLSLPGRINARDLPDPLLALDLSVVAALCESGTERSDVHGGEPELSEFVADFIQRSEEGLRQTLQAEVDLLSKALKTGQEQSAHNAYGLFEVVVPVCFQGHVIHGLRLGKLRDRPFSADEIAAVAEVAGVEPARVEEAAAHIPLVSEAALNAALKTLRALKEAVEHALTEQVRVAELNHQLVQSERTRSLGTLSGGVAHHFNNLLSVILGYSSFVLNREDHSKEAADALHKITEAAQRGRRLTEEILSFSGTDMEEDSPCQVHDSLTNVLSLLESELPSHTRIVRNLDAKHDIVYSPPSDIHQIIFNLVTNGIDSMPGGGELTVTTSNTTLDTDGRKTEYLKLQVTDSSGLLPQGFEDGGLDDGLAQQAAAGDQTALRLSSVYGMVGRMDGTLMISTEPGALTRVEVLLPVSRREKAATTKKPVRRRIAPSAIWVVDDDPIFREMCHQVLGEEGHQVEEFADGRALHRRWKAKDTSPNLIIMDFSMPEYNGLELCEWLKAEGSRVPVVLVSGFSPKQPDIKKALKIRKTYFLQKPFTSRDLTDTVTVAMGETLIGE